MEPPAKRARLLDGDSDSDSGPGEDISSKSKQSQNEKTAFKINAEYAKRFEHNMARAEKHRLEEKYGNALGSESDSESESDDDEGELATKELDDEIIATLNAIKSKDPRVYDQSSTFYKPIEDEPSDVVNGSTAAKDKPIHLRDYHRQNLLEGATEEENGQDSYMHEQLNLKTDLLKQTNTIHEDEEDFLVKKPQEAPNDADEELMDELDVTKADADPEKYLTDFMVSRAWVPTAKSTLHSFESDNEEDDARAEEFENAYNLRFEDPNRANEKLVSHSREVAAKHSRRREEPTGRRRARAEEKARLEAAKLEEEEEKVRLRRLKVEEAQEKWQKMKQAAGLKQQRLSDEKMMQFLEEAFDGDKWDSEMTELIGDSYYDEKEDEAEGVLREKSSRNTTLEKAEKPTWDDDIDIGDIVPDFDEEDARNAQQLRITDDEASEGDSVDPDKGETNISGMPSEPKKNTEKRAAEQRRQARRERQKLEELVDASMSAELPLSASSGKQAGFFRYRETSPTTFGLNARDILMADDAQLNQFAGLKKLATFRDDTKKKRDKKKLGKDWKLRQWRKDTFGDQGGPNTSFEEYFNKGRGVERRAPGAREVAAADVEDAELPEKKKKRRKRANKGKGVET